MVLLFCLAVLGRSRRVVLGVSSVSDEEPADDGGGEGAATSAVDKGGICGVT